jgi:hypothetical protein
MIGAVELVCQALRTKQQRDGNSSLTSAEWHLLRVSQIIHAFMERGLARFVSETPVGGLLAIAYSFEAIGAISTAELLRGAAESLSSAGETGSPGARRTVALRVARDLDEAIGQTRPDLEQRLIDFAFAAENTARVA